MKKLKLLCLLPLLLLTSCDEEAITENSIDKNDKSNLVTLCTHKNIVVDGRSAWTHCFIWDKDTNNIYMLTYYSGDTDTCITPYYNKDGEIMKYSEFQKVHKHQS